MFLTTTPSRRGPRRTILAGAAAAAAATLALTGCSAGGGSGSGAADTLVVYTGQAGDYQINFNPYSPSQIGGIGSIYESLFFVTNANTDEPKPLLGTEQSFNEDGTVLTVDLRQDVTWSDGEPFTADDVLFTFQMLKDNPAINNNGFDGEVAATDDDTVTFTFDRPAYVTAPATLGRTPIVPEHLWADVDPAADVVAEPVGTGPFTLGDFKPQAFTLAANESYWDGAPAVKQVRYLSLSGNTAGVDALAAGTIDWQTGPVPDIENVADNYPGYDAVTIAQNQVALFTCSNAELGCTGPQTDPAVRHAIYRAIDRTQVNALAFQDTSADMSPTFALPTTQEDLISDAVDEKLVPLKADTAASDELLEGAGWAKGSDGIYAKDGERLSLTVEVVTGWTDYITAIDTMGQQLKTAGIELNAAQSSWNEWTDKKGKGNFQLAIDSLGQGAVADPYYLYNQYFDSQYTAPVGEVAPTNMVRFSSPVVDEALETLRGLAPEETEARQVQFDAIQAEIVEDMPYIPFMTGGTTSEFKSSKFTGWPEEGNFYAFPAIWASPDNAEIFKALRPVGE